MTENAIVLNLSIITTVEGGGPSSTMRKRAKRKDLSQHGVHHVPLGIVAARLAAHPSSNSGSVAASRRARRRQRAASDISSTRGAAQPFVGGAPLMSARDATLAATHMCKVAVLFAQLAVEDACFVTERARSVIVGGLDGGGGGREVDR